MGLVYLATSPSGKSYVGQTTKPTAAARWAEHVSEASGARDYSWRLNRAIRKHGGETFELMVLWECGLEELDEWETFFIELFETQMPGGYNLSKGGKNGFKYTPEVRAKMSQGQRKNEYEGGPLPPYMFFYPGRGFGVRPPGKRIKYFRSVKEPMEQKYASALAALQHPELLPEYTPKAKPRPPPKPRAEWNLGKPRQSPEAEGLPRYVTYISTTGAVKVQKPGHPVRSFGSSSVPLEERKRQAIEYLESLQS